MNKAQAWRMTAAILAAVPALVICWSWTARTAPGDGDDPAFTVVCESLEINAKDLDFGPASVDPSEPAHTVRKASLAEPGLLITLHEQEEAGGGFARQWIELKPEPGRKVFIKKIVLFRFKPLSAPQTFDGPGQPVYVGDSFHSVAYPSAKTYYDGENVIGEYDVGLEVGEEGYTSYFAVAGDAAPGKVKEAFYACVESLRVKPAQPFLLWNTWYDLYNFTDEEAIAGIEDYRKLLVEPYGLKLDSVVLDDGWDDWFTLWSPHRTRFPRGFGPVQEAAESIGARLGLWMSPIGGYGTNVQARILGTLGQGYEKNLPAFCFAGETYNRAFTDRMVKCERDHGVNYFKLDNLSAVCYRSGHGHRTGKYARVGLTDSFISTLGRVRAADPEVTINFTVGSWLSPWWLMYADVIWRGGWDFQFAGEGSKRQQSITYVDSIIHQRLVKEKSQFPVNSLMTHGIIKGKRESLGETGENLRDFSDDVFMYFGRGVAMWELYLTPSMLSEAERKVLMEGIRFGRERWELLGGYTEMVGGDPGQGEVYGYRHGGKDGSLLALRNPGSRTVAVPDALRSCLGEGSVALHSSTGRDPLDPLGPFEVRIIENPQVGLP